MAGSTQAAKKWKERVGQSKNYLSDGITGKANKFDQAVSGAGPAYEEGVRQAMSEGRYQKNVSGAGNEWESKMRSKGVDRWVDGVAKGEADYMKGAGPVIDALQSADYGPRGARGSQANMDRQKKAVELARGLRQRSR